MCYQRQYMCIREDTGSLILGIVSAVITGVLTVISVSSLVTLNFFNYVDDQFNLGYPRIDVAPHSVKVANIFFGAVAFKSTVDFLFAVLLCDGICRKKLRHIKVYQAYGLVNLVVCIVLVSAAFWKHAECAHALLAFLILYCLLLHMVDLAHDKISRDVTRHFDHKRLIETVY